MPRADDIFERVTARATPKKRKRRRCENCNRLYQPIRDDQRFCRDRDPEDPNVCRKEFWRYGSSYGPLKAGLEKAITKKVADFEASTMAQIRLVKAALSLLDGDFKKWREQVALLLVERARPNAAPNSE